jgi:hypothetical protein
MGIENLLRSLCELLNPQRASTRNKFLRQQKARRNYATGFLTGWFKELAAT